MAALTSRLRTAPHLQVHSRSCKVSSLFMLPQQEQVLLLGSNLPMRKIFLPYHSALYSNMVTNVPHPASEILCARQWFFNMFLICKSSIATDLFSLINFVEVLCKKSFRWLATFSCKIANRCLVLLPLCLEYLDCVNFNLLCALRRNLGLSNSCPSEVTKKVLIPKSIPIVVFSFIVALLFIASPVSQSIETKYLPVGVLLIVACLIVPLTSLCKTISIPVLNFGITSLSFSSITFCGILKNCFDVDFFLKLGKSACPLKNFVKATSKFTIDCCSDWLLTSFNHSHSFFNSGNCFTRSKQDRFTLLPAYAICLHSKAKLKTNLALPICLFISSACSFVGNILYLNALSMVKRYKFYIEEQLSLNIFTNFVPYIQSTLKSDELVLRHVL